MFWALNYGCSNYAFQNQANQSLGQTTQANQPAPLPAAQNKLSDPHERRQDCNASVTTLLYWCKARKTTLDSIDSLGDLIICFIQILFTSLFLHRAVSGAEMGQLKQNWFCRHRKPQKRMCLQTQKHHTFFGKEGTGEKKKISLLNRMESMANLRFIWLQCLSPG